MGDFFQPMHLLILGIAGLFLVVPFWIIFKKAGFPPALSIILFVPFVGILILYVVAFSEWKVVPRQPSIRTVPPYPPEV
jgi:hypothetical protein